MGSNEGSEHDASSPVAEYDRSPVTFVSGGLRCAGVLYRPAEVPGKVPCVVLAHGFSGTMDWIVPDFARRFASGGLAALIFDYRYLGASEGRPRQLISTPCQRAELRSAVDFARTCAGVDAARIALWGTSLGGSHVLELAANDPSIAAVVANVSGLDFFRGTRGRAKRPGFQPSRKAIAVATARLLGAAALDAAAGVLRRPPHYIRVYGPLGARGLLRSVARAAVPHPGRELPNVAQQGHAAVPVHRAALPRRRARTDQRSAVGDARPRRRGGGE